jgi:hypothetical protein
MSRVLDRTVDFLANRLDRRGFIGKTAVVGSAIVAAPLDFGLRPKSAYAAVCNCNGSRCGCGALCCDGYTEFCCTLTGANACPPGTITAGWWKVDGSSFCGGAARYYLDCNAQCGGCTCGSNGICAGSCSGTGCGCARGSCNNRKAGCTRFRYGQCHQNVRCVGPIVCRVVTCKPPWQFDPACGTSSRTDNATRWHDRACLNEPFGNLDSVVDTGRGTVRVRGWSVDQADYGQSTIRVFVDGNVVAETVANQLRADVWTAYPAFGPHNGYDLEVPAAPGRRTVCTYAIDRSNGRSTVLGFREVNVRGPDGRIDRMIDLGNGQVRVEGWAMDPTRPGRPPNVRFRVDGQVHLAQASIDRPDVVRAYPGATLRCGFTHVISLNTGERRVCADVQTADARWHQFRCRTQLLQRLPFGRLDSATDLGGGRVRVRGWAIDPPRQTGAAEISLRVGGTSVATLLANTSRPDVAAVYPGYGPNHGFDTVIDVPPGRQQICVDALHDGNTSQLRCRVVDVAG